MMSGTASRRNPELTAEPVEHRLDGGQPVVGDRRRIGGRAELRVEPQVDPERAVGQLANLADPAPQLLGGNVQAGQDPQAAGARHLGHQVGPGDASHAGLHDRVVDAEQIAQGRPQDLPHVGLLVRVAVIGQAVGAWLPVSPGASAPASAPNATSVSPTERMMARVPKCAIRTKPVRNAPIRLPTVDAA
jgi:hypothetical protein